MNVVAWLRELGLERYEPLSSRRLTKAVPETGEATVPASLHDSLMARLDGLADAKNVAQIAACVGREFDHALLAAAAAVAAADRPETDLLPILDQLTSAEGL